MDERVLICYEKWITVNRIMTIMRNLTTFFLYGGTYWHTGCGLYIRTVYLVQRARIYLHLGKHNKLI